MIPESLIFLLGALMCNTDEFKNTVVDVQLSEVSFY